MSNAPNWIWTLPDPEKSLAMIRHPEWWPIPNILALRKGPSGLNATALGVIIANRGMSTVVDVTNRDDLITFWMGGEKQLDVIRNHTIRYESLEAIIADGWVVD